MSYDPDDMPPVWFLAGLLLLSVLGLLTLIAGSVWLMDWALR